MGLCPLQQGFTLWNKTWHQHHAQIIQQLLLLNATALTNREWMHQCPSDITPQGVRESVRRCLFCLLWFPHRDKSVIMCTEPCPLVTRQDFHFSNRKTQTAMTPCASPVTVIWNLSVLVRQESRGALGLCFGALPSLTADLCHGPHAKCFHFTVYIIIIYTDAE